MASLTCPTCGAPIQPGDLICFECGANLARAVVQSSAAPDVEEAPPDPHPSIESPPGTLTLAITNRSGEHEVTVEVDDALLLGRDPVQSPVAEILAEFDNISRRHATVFFDSNGHAAVRDDGSTNGTFVNERRVEPSTRMALFDGDTLRLAANCTILIRL